VTDVLTLGFGTTVCMWVVAYLCRMPPGLVPGPVLLGLLLLCLLLGGFFSGRWSPRGARAGLLTGLISSVLNLLVLGSLLASSQPNRIVPSALAWVPGSLMAGTLLGWVGWRIGRSTAGARLGAAAAGEEASPLDWTSRFCAVAAAASLLLVVAGGLVTSNKAGLAVVDWPNSFGYAMFLYPLSRMTGGIYYEHAHRLFGSLVGLTTLVLALLVWRHDRRRGPRVFVALLFLLVVLQGILGGLRVTGRFTMSDSPADTRPSTALAVIHGVTGQVFFAALVAAAALTSKTWRSNRPAARMRSAGTDYGLGNTLLALLLVQLILGAILRHVSKGLLIHVTTAALVLLLTVAAGARALGLPHEQPLLRRLGRLLLFVLGAQILLGIGALIARGVSADAPSPPAWSVLLRTAHQACGALFLATATLLAVWNRRLLAPEVHHAP
jgi:heme A synthase